MAQPKNSKSINGAKYRCFKKKDGSFSDPLVKHDFFSRTFMPKGTEFIEGQEVSEIIAKIKADETIIFKEADLSDETIKVFDEEKIVYEKDTTSIEGDKIK